eukprot:m.114894 g.114894  ORF g.114894 m.114894 type:complete len:528 (+) comp9284_c1_seq6:2696-4279(+)
MKLFSSISVVAAVIVVLVACLGAFTVTGKKPNIIILLTDDQDALLNSTMFMPNLMKIVAEKGIFFKYGLANSPVCCPSRSSLLSGRFIHNHGAVNNSVQGNCDGEAWKNGPEKDSLAVHMQQAGYKTLYGGKYLNDYFGDYNPPGWTEWFGLHGNSRYYNYTIQDNDNAVQHGDSYSEDYLTDLLKRRGLQFVNESISQQQPFFLWLGTPAAHASFTPAPQYFNTAHNLKAPRTENFNKVYQDKHETLRTLNPLNQTQISQTDEIFGQRLGTLRSVDDIIGEIFELLESTGEADNTWFFYTGDNGFHLGQFAMGFDKRQLYETDIRVPYFVRGPGSLQNVVRNEPISHVDLAATIIDIATGSVPEEWDGLSYKHLLVNESAEWKSTQFIQYFGETSTTETCGAYHNVYTSDNDTCWFEFAFIPAPCDGVNNTYNCVRRISKDLSVNDIFCEFTCFNSSRDVVPCPTNQAEGYGEYYDLNKDPWQTVNKALDIPSSLFKEFSQMIDDMRNCSGQQGCQRNKSKLLQLR